MTGRQVRQVFLNCPASPMVVRDRPRQVSLSFINLVLQGMKGVAPYTGANTHKSKIPLKIRKYAFSAIAQFLRSHNSIWLLSWQKCKQTWPPPWQKSKQTWPPP